MSRWLKLDPGGGGSTYKRYFYMFVFFFIHIFLPCVLIAVSLDKCICSVSRCCIARDYCVMNLRKKHTHKHTNTNTHREDNKILSLTIIHFLYS